jgi:hypothetical protein
VDLATLLGHFVGLRQEVNLQTRSVRAQQEQTGELFRRIEDGLAALARARTRAEQVDPTEIQKPLLKTLVDLYDALALAAQQIQRTQTSVMPMLEDLGSKEAHPEPPPSVPAGRSSFWSRWFLSPSADAALRASREQTSQALEQLYRERCERQDRARNAREAVSRIRQVIEGLVTGYTMSLERIDHALAQHGLDPIPTVGETFDPELMEAMEGVPDTGRPHNEVVEEIRRGYLLNGRVFRCALVRVARS